MTDFNEIRNSFYESLLLMDQISAKQELLQFQSASEGLGNIDLIENILFPTLERVGREWDEDILSLAQLYMISKICEDIVEDFLPREAAYRKAAPKISIAVFEDYHLLGKKLVCSAIRADGYLIDDYGHGLKVEDIIHKADKQKPDILLISTLMLASALHIKELIQKMGKNRPKIVVGGAPFLFDDRLFKEIGADAMGRNSTDALKIINRISEGQI
jgi:methanogenic corrinoid protein MtbC1